MTSKNKGKHWIILLISFLTAVSYTLPSKAQQEDTTSVPKDWFLLDPETDHVQGVSADRTYLTLLKGKPSKTVLVAVIDSGIDVEHEDLKDIIWVNADEIPNNGIDDDKNGYVDDLNGWNFIGGKNGNVAEDTYEVTREYARLKPKYENAENKKLSKKDKVEFEYWKKVKAKYDRDYKSNKDQYDKFSQQFNDYSNYLKTIISCDSIVRNFIGKPVTKSVLDTLTSTKEEVLFSKNFLLKILEQLSQDIAADVEIELIIKDFRGYVDYLKEAVAHFHTAVAYGYSLDFNSRTIIGDNPNNLYEKGYGNNDVKGPDAQHGTHVAGIIGANRNNSIGIKGIADNVRIMSVRAVPNGDERDKDIANAILYATDNGAQIINMSFGKSFSPNKEVVDKAVKYAESKGVLLIHAAGNDNNDMDKEISFPSRTYKDGMQAKAWIEIGASAWGSNEDFVGSFSNYGKKSVDLFAPGVQIYSTTPNNTYEDLQGTSMACPAAVGVAAILLEYFPDLNAEQLKSILSQSTRKFDGLKVTKPGTTETVPFSQLSISGGIINAYEAVKLATTLSKTVTNNK